MENNKKLLVSGFNLFHQIDFSDSTRQFGFESFSPLKKNDCISSTPNCFLLYGENIVNACGSLFYNMYLTNFGRVFLLGNFHVTDHEFVTNEFQTLETNYMIIDDNARDCTRMIVSTTSHKRFYELSMHSSLTDVKIVQIACGRDYSLLLSKEGFVFSFGNNVNNQCAFPLSKTLGGKVFFPVQIQSPVQVLSRAVTFSCGQKHSIVLMSDRTNITTFGDNNYGQLGIGNMEIDPERHTLSCSGFMDIDDYIEKIECGGFHSLVLTRNGTILVFGRNMEGQLGFHSSSVIKPTQLTFFKERNLKVKSVACGEMHSLFLTYCGQVFACGSNYKGELGLGRHGSLVQHVMEPTKINFGGSIIGSISCGSGHSLAISKHGMHFAFGQNQEGQLALKGSRFEFVPKKLTIASTEQLTTTSLFSNSSCFCSFLIREKVNPRLCEFFIKLTTPQHTFADCTIITS